MKFRKDKAVWYSRAPIGINQLYNCMPRLSDEPGLSRRCTNRCIRDMEASNLCDAGVSNMGIMTVTVHRNVQFLKEASTLKSPNLNLFKVLESQ